METVSMTAETKLEQGVLHGLQASLPALRSTIIKAQLETLFPSPQASARCHEGLFLLLP